MVHNARQKVMVLSSILSIVCTAFIIASIASPNWMVFSNQNNNGQFRGLFQYCQGSVCSDNNFSPNGQDVFGSLQCTRNGSELSDRFRTTAACVLAGAAIVFIVFVFQFFQIVGLARLSDTAHMWLAWSNIAAFLVVLVGVAIFGGTFNSWWNCGSDFCQAYQGTETKCGVAFGYFFCIVACSTLLLAAVLVMLYTKFPQVMYPTADIILMVGMLEIFSIALISIGTASVSWVEIVPAYRTIGLFQNCTSSQCDVINFPLSLVTTTVNTTNACTINGTSFQSRFSAAAAFLIFAAVLSAVLTIFFFLVHMKVSTKLLLTRKKKQAVLVAIGVNGVAQIIGMSIAMNTINSYYFCGSSFCSVYNGYCHPGVSFGLIVASIGLTFFIFLLQLFEFNEWCCFQERFASGRQTFSIMKVLRGNKKPAKSAEPAEEEAEDDGAVELPAGQWDYDSLSGFYWSEELYLFYDPVTQQFYDPNKDEWFARQQPQATPLPRLATAAAGSMRMERKSSIGLTSPGRATTLNTSRSSAHIPTAR